MQLGDFLTCVQHDMPIKIILISKGTLGLIEWEQMVFLGNPEYGPAIIECVADEHEPPTRPGSSATKVTKLMAALREGTPNRRRIAVQMVKDLLDESSFEASPAHAVPGRPARPPPRPSARFVAAGAGSDGATLTARDASGGGGDGGRSDVDRRAACLPAVER
jgi:pyruvate dehydrogenase (quinone)